jgi:hypothetical protein
VRSHPPLDRCVQDISQCRVRRLFCFLVAILIAVWVPAQTAGLAADRDTSFPIDDSAQTKQPAQSNAVDFGPHLISGSGGSWQARHSHDANAPEICPPGLNAVYVAVSKKTARLRLHIGQPGRTFPLLI